MSANFPPFFLHKLKSHAKLQGQRSTDVPIRSGDKPTLQNFMTGEIFQKRAIRFSTTRKAKYWTTIRKFSTINQRKNASSHSYSTIMRWFSKKTQQLIFFVRNHILLLKNWCKWISICGWKPCFQNKAQWTKKIYLVFLWQTSIFP